MIRAADWLGALVAVALWAGLTAAVAEDAGAYGIERGAVVTYTDRAGAKWCATVRQVQAGVAGVPTAWLTINADPRRAVHEPVADLSRGCL